MVVDGVHERAFGRGTGGGSLDLGDHCLDNKVVVEFLRKGKLTES